MLFIWFRSNHLTFFTFLLHRFHNVQIAQKRDTQPLVFDSDDVIVLGKPEPLSGTVNISTSVRTRQDSHAAVPRSVLCNFVKHSRKSVSRLMGNHPVLLINGQRIPSCVETLTTIEPPTTDSIPAGSGKVTSSFTQGIQAGLVIAVIAVLAIGGSLVCYFRWVSLTIASCNTPQNPMFLFWLDWKSRSCLELCQ